MTSTRQALVVFATYGSPAMGPRRIRRLVRHLPGLGWAPTVLTDAAPVSVSAAEMPPAPVIQARSLDLARLFRSLRRAGRPDDAAATPRLQSRNIALTTWINRWFMIPDKYVVWRARAVRQGREFLSRNRVDLIFASHQPATNLLVAAQLSREFHIPLFVEYRDLWTHSPYVHLQGATRLHDSLHARLERSVLRQAAAVSCVAQGIAGSLTTHHGDVLRRRPLLNHNFYDPAEYPAGVTRRADTFTVSFVGAMYLSREPSVWLKGLRQFIDSRQLGPDRLRFRWMGPLAGIAGLEDSVRESGVEPYVDYLGTVSHERALDELMRSHVALHIQSPDDVIHVPGKLFEALGARTPLLAISRPCEVTELVARTRGGLCCEHDPGHIAAALTTFWQDFEAGRAWVFDESERATFAAEPAVARLCASFAEALQG